VAQGNEKKRTFSFFSVVVLLLSLLKTQTQDTGATAAAERLSRT
jgi:hypothetical protein